MARGNTWMFAVKGVYQNEHHLCNQSSIRKEIAGNGIIEIDSGCIIKDGHNGNDDNK